MDLGENIIDILCRNIDDSKYAIHITDQEKDFVQKLAKNNPEIFGEIQKTINDIMSDGKIDLHDVPKIVLLVSQIMKNHVIENAVKHIKIVSVVRFIIDSLLDSGFLPLPNIEIQIIKKIVDSSLDLLKMDTNVKMKFNCCGLFCF